MQKPQPVFLVSSGLMIALNLMREAWPTMPGLFALVARARPKALRRDGTFSIFACTAVRRSACPGEPVGPLPA